MSIVGVAGRSLLLAIAFGGCIDFAGPSAVGPPTTPTISVGPEFTCSVIRDGHTLCWGHNERGQLGIGTTDDHSLPQLIGDGVVFAAVDVGESGGCALTTFGATQCWGPYFSASVPSELRTPQALVAVVAGGTAGCGLDATRVAWCWGVNTFGQVGSGDVINHEVAVKVAGGRTFSSITAGLLHACALTDAGEAWCWGHNLDSELGTGTAVNSLVPVQVSGGSVFKSISAGGGYTCGIAKDDSAYCWGSNAAGQLGVGDTERRLTPAKVLGGLTFASIQAGKGNSTLLPTCGVTLAGDAYCWGYNEYAQLGASTSETCVYRGTPTPCATTPIRVTGLGKVTSIGGSTRHSCAVTTDKQIYCWGDNARGELGNGSTRASSVPVKVLMP
ncbi:MAG: hypothetical protein V4550_18605 [Gemmatimonadota bacterium]